MGARQAHIWRCRSRRGFTLAELLIALTLMGLLIALLLPSLLAAKDGAQSTLCRNHLRQLHTAWFVYTTDHQNELVPAETDFRETWVLAGNNAEAIQEGRLFPYADSAEIYRCPADYTAHSRSYSINNYMNGAFIRQLVSTRLDDIRTPSQALVMLEENDNRVGYTYNPGSWLNVPTGSIWLDRPGVFHPKSTNMVFADGHTATRVWHDVAFASVDTAAHNNPTNPTDTENEDLAWMQDIMLGK